MIIKNAATKNAASFDLDRIKQTMMIRNKIMKIIGHS